MKEALQVIDAEVLAEKNVDFGVSQLAERMSTSELEKSIGACATEFITHPTQDADGTWSTIGHFTETATDTHDTSKYEQTERERNLKLYYDWLIDQQKKKKRRSMATKVKRPTKSIVKKKRKAAKKAKRINQK